MAERPAWTIIGNEVQAQMFPFKWNGGFAVCQKKKNIYALHSSILERTGGNALECSTKSDDVIGNQLSAFNLMCDGIPVECWFQSGKVFENGGPYLDLLQGSSKMAKTDFRIHSSGRVIGFESPKFGTWSVLPRTAFYDYIYNYALYQSTDIDKAELLNRDWFTDIEFNPKTTINCQARAVTLYKYLMINGLLEQALDDKDTFIKIHKDVVKF